MKFKIFAVALALVAILFISSGVTILTMKFYHLSSSLASLNKAVIETDGLSAMVFVIIGLLFCGIALGSLFLGIKEKTV